MTTINKKLYDEGFECIGVIGNKNLGEITQYLIKEAKGSYNDLTIISGDLAIAGCKLEKAGYEWKNARVHHFLYAKTNKKQQKEMQLTFERKSDGKKLTAFLHSL